MISVIIPTYKNKEQLIKNLKKNLSYLKKCEIIIVNDDPNQSLANDLKNFPQIKLFENSNNLGFGLSVNTGVQNAKGEYVLLLNNDVILKNDDFKKTLLKFKKNKDLFAVSFAQTEKNGLIVGHNRIFWKNGLIFHEKSENKTVINGWAEGGSCLIDRKKFLNLNGFDPLYSPFYWEDIDLSYRAWKSGYKIEYDPTIIVEHHHQSTIGKYFSENTVKTIAFRNQFLFIWKNISDPQLILNHYLYLIPNIIYYLTKGELNFIFGFISALKRLLMIDKNKYKISDKKILDLFK